MGAALASGAAQATAVKAMDVASPAAPDPLISELQAIKALLASLVRDARVTRPRTLRIEPVSVGIGAFVVIGHNLDFVPERVALRNLAAAADLRFELGSSAGPNSPLLPHAHILVIDVPAGVKTVSLYNGGAAAVAAEVWYMAGDVDVREFGEA